MSFKIALVGRPNVGKSTLFNRLCGKKLALVHDAPGVTRDRRYGEGQISDLSFTVIDTPGFETETIPSPKSALLYDMWIQTETALKEASLILFIIDGREGILPQEIQYAHYLRRFDKPCILVINKAEKSPSIDLLKDSKRMGFKDTLFISAEHGQGMMELYEVFSTFMNVPSSISEIENDELENSSSLQLAIVGQPNAGKSTLINQIVGEKRFLTGDLAGLTRESQSIDFEWKGHSIKLIDTAGLRKKAKITKNLEKLSVQDTLRAIQYAQAVCLIIDATLPLERQDITIAHNVLEEGRILLIILNKIDLIPNVDAFIREMRLRVSEDLPQVSLLPTLGVSALYKKNLDRIFTSLFDLYEKWGRRISTAQLNVWLEKALAQHPPPLSQGRRIKIKYMTQIKSRPPTFVLFISRPEDLPKSYLRYLRTNLAQHFNLEGIPLRLLPRKTTNPYQP